MSDAKRADALVEDVLRHAGRCSPAELTKALGFVARVNHLPLFALEAAYDRAHRQHLADRGIDP